MDALRQLGHAFISRSTSILTCLAICRSWGQFTAPFFILAGPNVDRRCGNSAFPCTLSLFLFSRAGQKKHPSGPIRVTNAFLLFSSGTASWRASIIDFFGVIFTPLTMRSDSVVGLLLLISPWIFISDWLYKVGSLISVLWSFSSGAFQYVGGFCPSFLDCGLFCNLFSPDGFWGVPDASNASCLSFGTSELASPLKI